MENQMARKPRGRPKDKPALTQKPSRAVVVGGALTLAVCAALLIFASLRSVSDSQLKDLPVKNSGSVLDERARQAAFEVVNSYPHDPASFTQGLLFRDGGFYESTGQYGQSKLRRLEFPSGKVLKETSLSPELFGEGLAVVGDRLIQLTWKSHRGFVYEMSSFRLLREFSYDTEGWGLAYDGKNLILSDGSSDLFFLDTETFKPLRRLTVSMNGQPIRELNELEVIDGEIWANVWQTDLILRIDPSTGRVTSFLNLKGILAPSDKNGNENVLNGIAYDEDKKRIFVTGKLWPRVFEIRLKS